MIGAAIALYMLYADNEPGADVVSAASDREQARVIFDMARQMVEHSRALLAMTQVYRLELVIPSTDSRYKVLSRDAPQQHGQNLHCAVIDELHAHKARDLCDVLLSSMGSRRQPMAVMTTTAGVDPHSIAYEVHRYAEAVKDGGVTDETYLPVIYAAPEDADPWDEAVWRQCNPALRSGFRSLGEMRTAASQAKEIPGREAPFRQLYLNQWGTAAAARWLPLAAWDACRGASASLLGRPAIIGVDLSATVDLTALVIVCPDEDGGYDVRAEFYCPKDTLQRRGRQDHVPYPLWAEQGVLKTTPGNTVDDTFIEARIHELMGEYDVTEVALDPWNARGMGARLVRDLGAARVVEVSQTMANLTSASKLLETLVLSGQLRHDGHPIMRWCVGNAVADTDGNGNLKPMKKRSHERIDGVSALVTALARAMLYQTQSVAAIIL
jgi:phage terminase large subunit-like protein